MTNEIFYCPARAFDCPYYEKGICTCENPIEECEDAADFAEQEEVVFRATDPP